MPKNKELRVEIIQLHYDVLAAGYGGRYKITELVTKNYQQLGVTKDVEKYVDSCNMYQRMKNKIEAPVEKLKLNEVLEKLWTYLIVDFITQLLLVARKDVILVIGDRLSKIAYL